MRGETRGEHLTHFRRQAYPAFVRSCGGLRTISLSAAIHHPTRDHEIRRASILDRQSQDGT